MTSKDPVLRYQELRVIVHHGGAALAEAAAIQAAQTISDAVRTDGRAAIILACANSQIEFLSKLTEAEVPWQKVVVLHMDEYIGLTEDHPASFRRFLRDHFIERLASGGPVRFYGIQAEAADISAEIRRYEALLRRERPCLCALGIGENGHLAFNDPPADLSTNRLVREVSLDTACRMQQVGEGHFPDLDSVPPRAVTLTIPALLAPLVVIGVVPERRKALAVAAALEGPIGPDCPASFLRMAGNVTLHLDRESASLLTFNQEQGTDSG